MAISVTIEVHRDFTVAASFDNVFDLLSDVPVSGSHFPKVDQLINLGDNAYRWEMEKIGVDKHAIQSIYACRYESDRDAGTIIWKPIKGEGNGVVSGSWKIKSVDEGTHLTFTTEAKMTLPLPSLLKLAISPVVKHEFNALIDTYTDRLKTKLSS
ncbi:SRPBCC family protein [Alkalimarinus alittae]|uniref:SRPBCC family protein n=1 Tax=Alkalimarinus alittae TaxID=2961619 RepID=A0ABY6N4X5_9ALTE|nr:SRPBCC family protein [Alkalimarinus alittae]UZE97024.1 SRPBCC family protein [Alkalimarinus alittae]